MESQLSLFEGTDCRWICYAPEYESMVQPWINARPMKASSIGSLNSVLDTEEVAPFVYEKSLDQVATEPAMVLHTSGSTGTPKPIICRHGMIAVSDAYHNRPEFSGYPHLWKKFQDQTSRVICTSMSNAPVTCIERAFPNTLQCRCSMHLDSIVLLHSHYTGIRPLSFPDQTSR